jgi:hypothetical protein
MTRSPTALLLRLSALGIALLFHSLRPRLRRYAWITFWLPFARLAPPFWPLFLLLFSLFFVISSEPFRYRLQQRQRF